MSTIPSRLRSRIDHDSCIPIEVLLAEAADEIERLEHAVVTLTQTALLNEATIAILGARLKHAEAARAKLDAADAEIARLRDQLRKYDLRIVGIGSIAINSVSREGVKDDEQT